MMLSTADLHDYFQSCVLLRGPTYRVHSTKINMLLDTTKVQCSASGGVLLTVSVILLLTFPDSNSCNYQRKKNLTNMSLWRIKKKICWKEMDPGESKGVGVILVNGSPFQSL